MVKLTSIDSSFFLLSAKSLALHVSPYVLSAGDKVEITFYCKEHNERVIDEETTKIKEIGEPCTECGYVHIQEDNRKVIATGATLRSCMGIR